MEEGFVDAGSNPLGGDARKAFATELVDQTEIWRERELLDLPVISFGGALVRYSPYFPKGIDRCHFRRGRFEFPMWFVVPPHVKANWILWNAVARRVDRKRCVWGKSVSVRVDLGGY